MKTVSDGLCVVCVSQKDHLSFVFKSGRVRHYTSHGAAGNTCQNDCMSGRTCCFKGYNGNALVLKNVSECCAWACRTTSFISYMNMINSNKVDFNSIIVKGDLNATAKHWMWDTQKLRSKKWHTIMTHHTPFTVVKSNQ